MVRKKIKLFSSFRNGYKAYKSKNHATRDF